MNRTIGRIILDARTKKNLTQKELARICGKSPMYISQLETGNRVPSAKFGKLLAKALELDENELMYLILMTKVPDEIKNSAIFEKLEKYDAIFLQNPKRAVTEEDIEIDLFDRLIKLNGETRKRILDAVQIYELVNSGAGVIFKKGTA